MPWSCRSISTISCCSPATEIFVLWLRRCSTRARESASFRRLPQRRRWWLMSFAARRTSSSILRIYKVRSAAIRPSVPSASSAVGPSRSMNSTRKISSRLEASEKAAIAHAFRQPEPKRDCPICSRLRAFRETNRAAHPDWFNGAVPSFGPESAQLLIVGLAPGLKGANRTGRPFLGDYAGELLYRTLLKVGFARGHYDPAVPQALTLVDCMITNAVRCVPPANKPTPIEITHCRRFLKARIGALSSLRVILALGRIAH